ncbi:hypothetical protein [Sphingobacterium thalpophilum]|uniref:hypothetical protein n=1 Tax=Sphingobacterium thalpophilum TaxID=259 RepID=UPI003C78698F
MHISPFMRELPSSGISDSIRSVFTGKWEYRTSFQTNSVIIWFEQDKDYACFKDIGSGEAPPITLRAKVKANLLVISAQQGQNDEMELEVIKGKLNLRTRAAVWDKKGNRLKLGDAQKKVFKRTDKME